MPTPSHPLTPTRRVGEVISISPTPTPTVEVTIGGDPTVTQFVPYLDSYVPTVNDYVVLLGNQGDYVAVGCAYGNVRKTFTPTWNSSTGTPPSIGNGSIGGWFEMVSPSRCQFDLQVQLGTTTTSGTAGVYNFSGLPFAGSSIREQIVNFKITSGVGPTYIGVGTIVASGSAVAQMFYQTNSAGAAQFGFAAPVLGAGGVLHAFGVYEVP